MKNPESPLTLDQFLELLELLVAVVIFISLMGMDTLKARKKRAHWIPQNALVLSALTIQIMGWLNAESNLLKEVLDDTPRRELNGDLVKNNLFLIHTSRVMLCVLVAYMLPGMARPGYEDSWGRLTALGLSIFVHILSELFSVYRRLAGSGLTVVSYYFYIWPHTREVSQYSFIVSNVIISITLVWLLLLLSCATIANKSIRDIIAQKIPIILAHQCDSTTHISSQAVENQVLKSWIVSRACYPEFIIARSVLTASASVAITLCILSSILGWLVQGPVIYLFPCAKCRFKFLICILQVIFIIVMWAIIEWRCLTCVAFYGRWQSSHPNESWRKYLRVEDFWTRYILKLQEAESKKEKNNVDEIVNTMIGKEGTEIWLLGMFLRCVLWLQFSVVYFSKGCWLLSELVLDNRLIRRLFPKLLSKQDETVDEDFSEYKSILENVDLLWDAPSTVFVSNRSSIKQAKELMKEGNMDGRDCDTLISFLGKYRSKSTGCVDIRCLDPAILVKNQTGLKFLRKGDPVPALDVEKNFIYAGKQSWKLTAVSLINIILRLSPSHGENALNAYSEACEVMDLVDDSEPATDSLLSKAADSLFKTLQEQTAKNVRDEQNDEDATARIQKLAEESKTKADVKNGLDSLDWEKAGAGNAVYKLCKSIDCSSPGGDSRELVTNELQNALADIIGGCIEKVGEALLDDCTKWAQDFQERKLLKAVYFAGKNTGAQDFQERKLLKAVYFAGKNTALMEQMREQMGERIGTYCIKHKKESKIIEKSPR